MKLLTSSRHFVLYNDVSVYFIVCFNLDPPSFGQEKHLAGVVTILNGNSFHISHLSIDKITQKECQHCHNFLEIFSLSKS